MTTQTILELVGYFASLLVLISLLMVSALKLRIINGIGSFIFAIYALLIRSYPTAVMNFCLVLIDIYFLATLLRPKQLFSYKKAGAKESTVEYLLEYYREDILHYFQDFDSNIHDDQVIYLVFAGAIPAGVFVANQAEDGMLRVLLDYATPDYRDCSVSTYLYGELAKNGVNQLITHSTTAAHTQYLLKMGYAKDGNVFVKTLGE